MEARDDDAHWLGGALAVVGGLGYFAALLLHGDLPDRSVQVALAHIAARPEWRVLKLALMAFLMCWLGAFVALARSVPRGRPRLLARWATGILAVGVALVVVEYAIIGHALKDVADAWRAGTRTAEMLALGEVLLRISGGLFHAFVTWLMGLPFLLLGAAVASSRTHPRWLGWVPIVTGAGALLAGATRFLGIPLVPYPLLYGAFIVPSTLWLAAMGVLLWRHARASELESRSRI